MNNEGLLQLIQKIADKIIEQKDYLTELDRPIGDNDHGINMARGFDKVIEKLPTWEGKDFGTVLKGVGMTLVSTVGGSAGPLYGTAFMNAGKLMAGKTEADVNDLIAIVDTAIAGVKMRGKGNVGEATMLDAMAPCLESMQKSLADGAEVKAVVKAGAEAAMAGAEATIPMVATKGRASYVGERGIGHQDPGATSFAMMMGVLADMVG